MNEADLNDEPTDEMIDNSDNWLSNMTAKLQLLVKDEIIMLLFHKRQIDTRKKVQIGHKWKSCHSEREQYFIRCATH